jgi:hypothetical protein
MPATAWAHAGFCFSVNSPATIKQFNVLKTVAASCKILLRDLWGNLFLLSLADAIHAHSPDAYLDGGLLQQASEQIYIAKIADLAK